MIKGLPLGKIYYKYEHGKARPYTRRDGKEKYLAQTEAALIEGLTNRGELERAIEYIEENLHALGNVLDELNDPQLLIPSHMELSKFGNKTRLLSNSQVADEIDAWRRVVAGDPKHATGVNITSDGTLVKSRAEVIGYEFLKMRGVEFKYEQPIMINGVFWYPDFSIIRNFDRKLLLWDHLGMMDKEEYRNLAERKLYGYSTEGFFPYKNLILTYDFGDDNIDLVALEEIMKMMKVL